MRPPRRLPKWTPAYLEQAIKDWGFAHVAATIEMEITEEARQKWDWWQSARTAQRELARIKQDDDDLLGKGAHIND
jgi:hypothetical protein